MVHAAGPGERLVAQPLQSWLARSWSTPRLVGDLVGRTWTYESLYTDRRLQ